MNIFVEASMRRPMGAVPDGRLPLTCAFSNSMCSITLIAARMHSEAFLRRCSPDGSTCSLEQILLDAECKPYGLLFLPCSILPLGSDATLHHREAKHFRKTHVSRSHALCSKHLTSSCIAALQGRAMIAYLLENFRLALADWRFFIHNPFIV